MQVTGIIAEYNPFHNGHAYHLAAARRQTNADYLVVVMSGNYVQRGVPALLEQHLRARAAVENGADLVIELPVRCATASAGDFAAGAVRTLELLGVVTQLCFGSESGDLSLLLDAARLFEEEPPAFRALLQAELKKGAAYPAARQKAFAMTASFSSVDPKFLEAPNNILAIEYLRALHRTQSAIRPATVTRTSDNYHSGSLSGAYASATAIRTAFSEGRLSDVRPFVPASVYEQLADAFSKNAWLTEDDFSLPLKYRLLSASPETLADCLDVPPYLVNRIAGQLSSFTSFSTFAELLKTREITRTKINRCLLHILLQLEKTPVNLQYLHLLGMRRDAAPLLAEIRRHCPLPLVSGLAALPQEQTREDLFAANLYHSALACKTGFPCPDERRIPAVYL